MADWNKKYYYTFRNTEDQLFTVEIWEDIPDGNPIPVPTQIRGDASPAILQYNADNLYTPVRGSGAELTLLSTSDRMYFNLYTSNMLRYQVRIYKTVWITPIYSVEVLVWLGFLDSENYREPFDLIADYPVSVTANDGFNLLSRMAYIAYDPLTEVYSKYTGLDAEWTVLMRVIQKLNLPWVNIYVGLSSTIPGVTLAAGETVLHRRYVNNDNYYNEDGEPETCRTVLENLLISLGAYIVQLNGDLYITDSNHVASGTTASFKKYAYGFETTAYVTTVNINIDNGDISTLKPQTSKITMEVEPGINKQVVSYSPYNLKTPLEFDPVEDFSGTGTDTTYGTTLYRWTETSLPDSESWTKSNSGEFINMVGIDGDNTDVKESYLKITNSGLTGEALTSQEGADSSTLSFTYKKPLPFLIPSSTYRLKLECEIYIRTVNDLNNPAAPPTIGISVALLTCRLKIGSKKYHRGFYDWDRGWTTLSGTEDLTLAFYQQPDSITWNPINDKWFTLGKQHIEYYGGGTDDQVVTVEDYLIDITSADIDGGVIELEVYGFRVYDGNSFTEVEVEDFRIRNLNIKVVDLQGNEVDTSDIEYLSKLDALYANAGDEVRTLHGTNTDGYPIQRGNLLTLTAGLYAPLAAMTKAGVTDLPERLLLRSIKSNYGGANIKLFIDLPAIYNVGFLTYASYFSGKNLAILSNRIDLAENVSGLTLREVHPDDATIIE